MRGSALALVESPAQLLNVVELGAGVPDLAGVPIAVLPPATGRTRDQLRAMTTLAREQGHEVTWHEARAAGPALLREVGGLANLLLGRRRLVVGDPYSGIIQVLVSLGRPEEVTIVDDGTATLEFARQWTDGDELSRWHHPEQPAGPWVERVRSQLAAHLRRRLSAEFGCRLRVFTSLPVNLGGVEVLPNDYGWLRSRFGPPQLRPGADLVGTSLVETGVVSTLSYLQGVSRLTRRFGVQRYLAHRKEAPDKLALVAGLGLEVVRAALPLEIVARQGPVGATLVSFPSTVVHTLPIVLGDTPVELVVCGVGPEWFRHDTDPRAEDFLGRVAATARIRHQLRAVAG